MTDPLHRLGMPKLALAISASIIFFILLMFITEVTFRLIGYDFNRGGGIINSWPIYYRQPTDPIGNVFFKRSGPAEWTGRPLSAYLDRRRIMNTAYCGEAEILIKYDKDGFRNPEDLTDWDIVFVGDSFVELGYLPYEDLFTTRIGKILGVKVKNLGVSYTGPLTHIYYLGRYGKGDRTRHAVLVFCEGNDIQDLSDEHQQLTTFNKTGKRGYRNIQKQTSFLKALYHFSWEVLNKFKKGQIGFNAYFLSAAGEIPVSTGRPPLGTSELTAEQKILLNSAIGDWAGTARTMGMTPWLVYMPSKYRVIYARLRFTENAGEKITHWKATDLPEFVGNLCQKNNVRFVNVIPELLKETERGSLTYNSIGDHHLNRNGSAVVAGIIAEEIKAYRQK